MVKALLSHLYLASGFPFHYDRGSNQGEHGRLTPICVHMDRQGLFWIVYMDRPRVGGVWLVDWCTRQPTHRALKTRSCSRFQPWKVHAWEVFDWFICGLTRRAFKTRSHSGLNLLNFFPKKNIVRLSALVERFSVSRMRDFFIVYLHVMTCFYI